jgi:hypothetical protein
MKDRDDRSSGIEILMDDAFAKINPTDPSILARQAARRNRNRLPPPETGSDNRQNIPEKHFGKDPNPTPLGPTHETHKLSQPQG